LNDIHDIQNIDISAVIHVGRAELRRCRIVYLQNDIDRRQHIKNIDVTITINIAPVASRWFASFLSKKIARIYGLSPTFYQDILCQLYPGESDGRSGQDYPMLSPLQLSGSKSEL